MLTIQQFENQVKNLFPNENNPLFSSTPTKQTVLHVCNFDNFKVKYIGNLHHCWIVINESNLVGVGTTLEDAIKDYEESKI